MLTESWLSLSRGSLPRALAPVSRGWVVSLWIGRPLLSPAFRMLLYCTLLAGVSLGVLHSKFSYRMMFGNLVSKRLMLHGPPHRPRGRATSHRICVQVRCHGSSCLPGIRGTHHVLELPTAGPGSFCLWG